MIRLHGQHSLERQDRFSRAARIRSRQAEDVVIVRVGATRILLECKQPVGLARAAVRVQIERLPDQRIDFRLRRTRQNGCKTGG